MTRLMPYKAYYYVTQTLQVNDSIYVLDETPTMKVEDSIDVKYCYLCFN